MIDYIIVFGLPVYALFHALGEIRKWLSRQSDWNKYITGEFLPLNRWRIQHSTYLATPHWRNFSTRIRLERKACEVKNCFVSGLSNLQVHHLHYNSPYKEQGKDVKVLCDKHHRFTHSGKTLVLINGKVLPPFGGKN